MNKLQTLDAIASGALEALRAIAQKAGPGTFIFNRTSLAFTLISVGRPEMGVGKLNEIARLVAAGVDVFAQEPKPKAEPEKKRRAGGAA